MPSCGHSFCDACWLQHMVVKVQEGLSRRLPCAAFRCGSVCDERAVTRLLSAAPESRERYSKALLDSFCEDNERVRWCPSVPHCGAALMLLHGDAVVEPTCSCGHSFCFSCGQEPHAPATCAMLAAWRLKCADESETVNWLNAHTKPCPKCAKPIEKASGCNLVQCTCGTCICWLCGAQTGREHTWSSISGHTCGRYRADAEAKAEQAAAVLERYLHFHGRWRAHRESGRMEADALQALAGRVEALEASGSAALRDYGFLGCALQQLTAARRVLAHCYVFAFCFFASDAQYAEEAAPRERKLHNDLFDDSREALELTSEELSKLACAPCEEFTEAMRGTVVNLTALADLRCANLHDIIEHELLGSLRFSTAHVAPYQARGAGAAGRAAAAARGRRGAGCEGVWRLPVVPAVSASMDVSVGASGEGAEAVPQRRKAADKPPRAPSAAPAKRKRRERLPYRPRPPEESAENEGAGAAPEAQPLACFMCGLRFQDGASEEAMSAHVDACLLQQGQDDIGGEMEVEDHKE